MDYRDNWLANFRAIVDAEIREAGGNAKAGRTVVGNNVEMGEQTIYQYYAQKSGKNYPSMELMAMLEKKYGNGRPPGWAALPPGSTVSSAEGPAVSSESFPQYVRDVSISVEGFAQQLDDRQRAALRNTLKVMLSDRLNFVNLDLNHLLPLLSDNSYSKRLGKGPGQPLQPIRASASQSVTNVIGFGETEQTNGEGTSPRPGGGKRGH